MEQYYYHVIFSMLALAAIVYVALKYFIAGYGFLRNSNWGPSIPNKIGWILMELPIFAGIIFMYLKYQNPKPFNLTILLISLPLFIHYLQRTIIFPFLIKGKSKMPIAIVLMGALFNTINAYMVGTWLYILAPEDSYSIQWLYSPQFIIGTLIFIFGMIVNIHSDYIIRHLRKPGDNNHYIPKGGMFKYVNSANYFGELCEWLGFAILTWSLPGLVFFIWTFANLVPRANSLHKKYTEKFGAEFSSLRRKKVFPFIY